MLILDSKIFPKHTSHDAPLFHFNTPAIEEAYTFLKETGVKLESEIENGHWFTFRDPDGNVLMACMC